MYNRRLCLAFALLVLSEGCDEPRSSSADASLGVVQGDRARPLTLEVGGRGPIGDPLDVNLQVSTNQDDSTYHTTLTVAEADALVVERRSGPPVRFEAHPLRAEFYHQAHLLVVSSGPEAHPKFHYFVDAIHWYTDAPAEESTSHDEN